MGVDAQMFVRTRAQFTQRAVRALSVDLVEAFGSEMFLLLPDWAIDGEWERETEVEPEAGVPGRHALRMVRRYTQDGDDIAPDAGETFLEVSLMGRYYGLGYERGQLHDYIAVAEWLEYRIPEAAVWYGGDSSGICAEPFNKAYRGALMAHFARHGHKPYRGAFGDRGNGPVCGFCGPRMSSSGGGQGQTFFYCAGCSTACARDDASGEVEVVTREDRHSNPGSGVFVAAKRLRARLAERAS